MQTALQQRLSCCLTSHGPFTRRPLRLRQDARGHHSTPQPQRCRKHLRTLEAAYGGQQAAQQPREQTSLALRQPAIVISRSQLAGKQVVTRTDGRILGVVDGLVADPDTYKVVAVSLSKNSTALPGEEPQQIGLMSLKQISDVLLVHDERAILREQLTMGLPYIQLVGKAVKTADGKLVGKVRDFDFCPDDGRITRLIIDALGIPAVPRKLLACQGVQMQLVQRATWSSITLAPGAEAGIDKLTTGVFDSAINLLKRSVPFISLTDGGDGEAVSEDMAYTNWWIDHGQQYERFVGKQVRRPSEAAIAAALAARRQAQPASAPQALPPARQPTYASQLQTQMPSAARQLQAEPAGWQQGTPFQQSQQQQPDGYSRSRGSNWPQQSSSQQAQRGGEAQFVNQQGWRQSRGDGDMQMPRFREDAQRQSSQPGTMDLEFQQPNASRSSYPDIDSQMPSSSQQQRLQQQEPSEQGQYQQQQQSRQQLQQQPSWANQGQQPGFSQANSYPESVRKVEQQRRSAARQSAGFEEPRFDPRRRKSSSTALTQPDSAQLRRAQQPLLQDVAASPSYAPNLPGNQQAQVQTPQQNAWTESRVNEPIQAYSGPAGASLPPPQLFRQAENAAAYQPASSNAEGAQSYSRGVEQSIGVGSQRSRPQQESEAAPSWAGGYKGWTQQIPDAAPKKLAVSPNGTIDVA